MARRRMNRAAATATAPTPEAQPAPAPAPVAVAPVAVAPVAVAPVAVAPAPVAVAPAPAGIDLPSNLSPALANIFSTPFVAPANLDLGDDEGRAQIRFYSGKGATVSAVNSDIPNITLGTPYIYCPIEGGPSYHRVGDLSYVALRSYAYYASHGSDYKVIKSWEKNPGKTAMVNGASLRVQECILSLGLFVPGNKTAMPAGLEPAAATLDTFRGAQCRGPKTLIAAQVATTKPEWAREGSNGAAVTAPVVLRVCAGIAGASKSTSPNANGETFNYTICTMFPATVGEAQVRAIGEWSTDAELQVELADYSAEFDRRVAEIESKR